MTMPLLADTFAPLYHEISRMGTLVGADRALVLWDNAVANSGLPGEYWECGVYRGGTAKLLAKAISLTQPRVLRLFDTFQGLPVPDPNHDREKLGDYAAPLSLVKSILHEYPRIVYHEGIVPKTFGGLDHCWIALAHLDMDLYRPTLAAIDFIWPRIVPGGCIIFDDWNWPKCPGVSRAITERFYPDVIWETGPMQCKVVKDGP